MIDKLKAYAMMCGIKGKPEDPTRYYQIFFNKPDRNAWKGPHRDSTDAENAAEDEAKVRGLELEWTNE